MRLIRGLLSLSLLAIAGCLYGFSGGGLPSGIKTVAVLPFENLTADPTLGQEIDRAVREAMERRLGLRQAGEANADAVVRGTITRYEADVPVQVIGGSGGGVNPNPTQVTKRLVQIMVSVRIINQHDGSVLWEQQSMLVQGDYDSGQEAEGRRKALERLTNNIVDGAQSQW